MRPFWLIIVCFVFVIVAGCSRSGDFGTFVVAEVAKHGGHAVTNTTMPTLQARWTVKSDTNGFQASVTGASFTSIDEVMQQAFGTPKVSVAINSSGHPHRVWGAVEIGVAIQLIGQPHGADIVCIRKFSDMGEKQ